MKPEHFNPMRIVSLSCVLCGVLACAASGGEEAATAVIRDSAGVTIVENPFVEPADIGFWHVDSVPALTIGVLDGEPAYEFGSIKSVRQLPNGMIVVLDGRGESAFEFRFFDSTGKHIATHGRSGMGPGEFRWVNFFGTAGGDTIVAVDFPARRISWLSASLGYLRSSMVDEPRYKQLLGEDVSNIAEGMVPLGDSLYAIKAYRRRADAATPFGGRFVQYDIVNLAADTTIRIAQYDEGGAFVRLQLSRGISNMSTEIETPIGVHVVDRTRRALCAATTRVTQLVCADSRGTRRIVRWTHTPVEFTADDRREIEDRIRGASYYGPGDADKIIAVFVWPTHYNPIRALQIDADGNFWILEYMRDEAGTRTLRFRVLNPDGEHIAFATGYETSPYGLNNAIEIGSNRVLRRITNADGVEQIASFTIRK
jgi:hypothetical protein